MKSLHRITMLTALLLCTLPAAAQPAPPRSFAVNPNYLPTQRLSMQLDIELADARNKPPRKTYRTPISLRVLRKSTGGTQLEWLAGKGTREDGAPQQDPIFDMAEKIFADMKLHVQLDAAGKYLGLRNEEELKARIQEFLDLLVPQTIAKIPDEAARPKASEAIRAALAPAVLLSAARKEMDLFFGISGLRLEPGKPVRVKSGLLNPFGVTGTLDGEMEVVAEPLNAATGEARVLFSQQYDPHSSMSYQAGQPARSAADAAQQMSMEDCGEFLLDSRTWQVKQVRHVRTIRQSKQAVRTETTVITVQ